MGVSKALTQLLADLGAYGLGSASQIAQAVRRGPKIPTLADEAVTPLFKNADEAVTPLFKNDDEVLKLMDSLFPGPIKPGPEGLPVEKLPFYEKAAREKLAAEETDFLITKMFDDIAKQPPEEVYDGLAEATRRDIARAPELRQRGEDKAENVLQMLASQRGHELTDADLVLNNPVSEAAFNQYLWSNYDLPMDAASRAERARSGPFPLGEQEWFRGSRGNSAAPRTDRLFTAERPETAGSYVSNRATERDWEERFSIAPLRFRDTPGDLNFSPRKAETRWSQLEPDEAAMTTRSGDIVHSADLGMEGRRGVTTDDIVQRNSEARPGSSVTFEGINDLGPSDAPITSAYDNIRATQTPENVRSRFARFDPRLAHLRNLNAAVVPPAAALTFGALGAPGEAEAAMPRPNIAADLLDSMNRFVGGLPSRQMPTGPVEDPLLQGLVMPPHLDAPEGRAMPPEQGPPMPDPNLLAQIDEAARHYFGPTGLDKSVPVAMNMFNPALDIHDSIGSSQEMLAPDRTPLERVGSAGDMMSSIGFAALDLYPGFWAAKGIDDAVDTGTDAARRFMREQDGSIGPLSRVDEPVDALASVNLPSGSDPRYLGAAPNRTQPYQRYTPKAVPERMRRLIEAADNPDAPIAKVFDDYIAKGRELKGSDWYNTEELRDWFVGELGEEAGDARWREFADLIGATSANSNVPQNIRNATFYNALKPADRVAVAELVAQGGTTPAAAARKLGIEVPNMPPIKGPGSYNYGHLAQGNQGRNVLEIISGGWSRMVPDGLKGGALSEWLQKNPKVKGFANDLLGDRTNIAADKHFMRILAMTDGGVDFLTDQAGYSEDLMKALIDNYGDAIKPYISTRMVKGKPLNQINLYKAGQDGVITNTDALKEFPTAWLDTPKKNEYAALEEMANRLAKRHDLTPGQFQANLWMGAGDVTNLADESQGTFMELFRRALDNRAGERGLTRKEMLRDFILNRAPLAVGPMGAIGLLGGQQAEQGDGA